MKEFKGTPGEWVIDYNNNDFGQWNTIGPAKIEYNYRTSSDKLQVIEADCKLIAAAPDLLDACQQLIACYDDKGQLLSFDVDIVRQALNKALA